MLDDFIKSHMVRKIPEITILINPDQMYTIVKYVTEGKDVVVKFKELETGLFLDHVVESRHRELVDVHGGIWKSLTHPRGGRAGNSYKVVNIKLYENHEEE